MVSGIIYVILEIRQKLWLWPVGIITSAVYIWIFFTGKLYADMSLQVYYLVISCVGWYWWIRGAGRRAQGAEHRAQGEERRAQGEERRAQGEERRAQGEETKGRRDEETGDEGGERREGPEGEQAEIQNRTNSRRCVCCYLYRIYGFFLHV